MLSRFW